VVIASKRIIDDLFHSKATDIFMVFMQRCNSFRLSLKLKKKSKEDLRHEFEAMKKKLEMAMETLKKESKIARAKQAEEIKKNKKGIRRNHVLLSSNAWS
jgi:thiamine biosynthesis lipoprotein ApbE